MIGDQYTRGVQEKAASQTKHLPAEVAKYRAEEETRFETPGMGNSAPFNGDLTLKELKTAISCLGSASKATGEDPISYHLIRRFPVSMIETLCSSTRHAGSLEQYWSLGRTPRSLLSPKRENEDISQQATGLLLLTPHLGKVYERLIKTDWSTPLRNRVYSQYARQVSEKVETA